MAAVRLGDLLVRMGVLTQPELDHAISLQVRHRVPLGQILVDHGLASEDRVLDALAQVSRLPRLDLRTVHIDPAAHRWSTQEWTEQHMVVPIAVDRIQRTMTVVISDPTDVGPLDELAFRTGLKVVPLLGSDREVLHIHRHLFHGGELARDRRAVLRPGQVDPREAGAMDAPEVLHGMDALRDHLQRASGAPPPPAISAAAVLASPGYGALPGPPPGPPGYPLPSPAPSPFLPGPGDSELPTTRPVGGAAATATDAALIPRLRALLDAQQAAARELQVLFELCVARGIIQRHEYLERLERDDGA